MQWYLVPFQPLHFAGLQSLDISSNLLSSLSLFGASQSGDNRHQLVTLRATFNRFTELPSLNGLKLLKVSQIEANRMMWWLYPSDFVFFQIASDYFLPNRGMWKIFWEGGCHILKIFHLSYEALQSSVFHNNLNHTWTNIPSSSFCCGHESVCYYTKHTKVEGGDVSETKGREVLVGLKKTWLIEPQPEIRPSSEVSDALRSIRSWSMLVVAWRGFG